MMDGDLSEIDPMGGRLRKSQLRCRGRTPSISVKCTNFWLHCGNLCGTVDLHYLGTVCLSHLMVPPTGFLENNTDQSQDKSRGLAVMANPTRVSPWPMS